MLRKGLLLTLGILLLSTLASHARAWDFDRSGIYLGVSGSYAIDMALEDALEDALPALGPVVVGVKITDSFGIQGRFGYRFIPHVAAEVQAEYLFGFDTKVESEKIAKHTILAVTANAKVFAMTEDIQPFALLGAGVLYADLEDSVRLDVSADAVGPAMRAGAGVDYYFSENIVVSVDTTYVLPFADVEDLDYLSIGVGVQYRF
jgi:opacity protein-like surface antigen